MNVVTVATGVLHGEGVPSTPYLSSASMPAATGFPNQRFHQGTSGATTAAPTNTSWPPALNTGGPQQLQQGTLGAATAAPTNTSWPSQQCQVPDAATELLFGSPSDGVQQTGTMPTNSIFDSVLSSICFGNRAFVRGQIDGHLLVELLELRLSIPVIANAIGVTGSQIKYFMKINNIETPNRKFEVITDEEIDREISKLIAQFPNAGHKFLIGKYKASGCKPIPRDKLRESLRRLQKVHNIVPGKPVRRRQYSVRGPLTMWHIDGHHSLIRWKFVIHGGIDGFSRLVVFLGLSNNNRADTVLTYFHDAVNKWGLPAGVRSDFGLENIGVADYMLAARDQESCFITGKSVHNQRIERHWRDVFTICVAPFYHTFYEMESEKLLDPGEDLDIAVLHHVVGPLLKETVDSFKNGWNDHPISTAENFSPRQLFTLGLLKLKSSGTNLSELNQNRDNITHGRIEADFMSLFSGSRRQHGLGFENKLPLTEFQKQNLDIAFNPQLVTLANLRECFLFVKNFVSNCIPFSHENDAM